MLHGATILYEYFDFSVYSNFNFEFPGSIKQSIKVRYLDETKHTKILPEMH